MKLFAFLILILFISVPVLFAQDYEDVTDRELSMTKLELDPSADAVVLYEKCEMRITDNFTLAVHVFRKIKVLTEAGKEFADVKIRYWYEDEINDIEAISYSPSGEETELDNDNVITTETDRWNTKTFTIPGVQVGSVITYEYKEQSEYITNMEPWVFQHSVFTIMSDLKIIVPKGFTYTTLTQGYDFNKVTVNNEAVLNPDNPREHAVQFSFIGLNLPGIKDEPYVDNIFDEYTKVTFMLESYRSDSQNIVLSKTWKDLAVYIDKFYRKFWDADFNSYTELNNIIQGTQDQLQKAKSIYDYVTKQIKLSDTNFLFGEKVKKPEEVLKDKSGTSNEKTLLLISALKKAGLNASPVLISSIHNGIFNSRFKNIDQFNKTICILNVNNRIYYLYPAFKSNPFGFLTPETDVREGLLVDENRADIININPITPFNRKEYTTDCTFDENLNIKGKSKIIFEGYPAFDERSALEEKTNDDIKSRVEGMIKDFSKNAVLDTFYYANIDSLNKPLELVIEYTLPEYLTSTGDIYYFSPPFYTSINKNPFVRDKRQFPIDFNYKCNTLEKVTVNLPEGMIETDVPSNASGSISDLSFSRINTKTESKIISDRTLSVYKRSISAINYPQIKEIFNKIASSDKGQIVMSRKSSH